ncbi:MAG: ROK family protein [Verrucomicrobia bacterium]|nr:ROK family protein [Verrucomicrobiota bacterium]
MKIKPILDSEFVPAVLWNRSFEQEAENSSDAVTIGLFRNDKVVARRTLKVLSDVDRSFQYLERLLKAMLWAIGGNRVLFAGPDEIFQRLEKHYSASAIGRFDSEIIGEKIYDHALKIEKAAADEIPEPSQEGAALGRHLDGCRIGFDLGGSDRKCAAVIDGEVVFSEEIKWDPYFEKNPQYHFEGTMASLKRAAEHLPRVDAIGGSAAGVYVNNEVRVASLFRGVPDDQFEEKVRPIFKQLKEAWGGIPFDVVNDGEVTALAGAMSLKDDAVLGISMGTSLAAGYVTPEGNITSWLNELAFVPVDYRENGPVDEWSGDAGCGVQFFSQQGVARLAPLAGIEFPADTPFAEQLVEVQRLMAEGDQRARQIYETIGVCFGYTIAHYSDFYDFRNLLILGRVTSGEGGQIIIEKAEAVLRAEFPSLAEKISITTPDEQMKRHGQAVAAASLPMIGGKA